jgi:serine/threonine-protein kinase
VVTDDGRVELATELAKRDIDLGPEIGRGAMSVVYRGHDTRHDRPLAVKVMSFRAPDPAAAERFALEIKVIARLRHPNIVPLIDSGTTASGATFFLMPLALGETARARLDRGPLPIVEAVRYAREIAEALAYAHSEGLLHRDVKPENILVEGGHAVLADFGVVRGAERESDPKDPTTASGLVVGTPAYMSPEQLTGEAIDGRADLYSLAVTFYELASGRLPFEAPAMPALLSERLTGEFEPLAVVCPEAPPELDPIVARGLAPDPADRYPDGAAMAGDLAQVEAVLAGGGTSPVRRFRARLAFLSTAAIVVAVAAAAWVRSRAPQSKLDPNRIVVADFQNETGDSSLAVIGPKASDWISAGLTGIPRLTVINSEYVLGAPRRNLDRRTASTSGRGIRAMVDSTRAAIVVSGSYYRESGRLEVFAEVTDARNGRLLLALGPLQGSPARPDSVLAMARDSIAAFIRAVRRGSN